MFNSPEGSLEEIFVNDYDMIDQYAKTGSLWVWGRNDTGELGNAAGGSGTSTSSPVQTIAGGTAWKQVSSSGNSVGAIKTDGTLWMWGYNYWGSLGDNTIVDKSSPVQTVAGGTNWKQVSAGGTTAAIKTDGTLWTWGFTSNPGGTDIGSLGDNTVVNKSSPVQTVAGGTNWKQVSAGNALAAIKTDGTLWTWGYNYFGTLGIGTSGSGTNKSSPVQTIAGGTNWKQVSSSGNVIGAIKTDGTLWMWGYNADGQVGDGTTVDKLSPVQTVAGGTNWKQVSTGNGNAAAIKTDGTFWTWGSNYYGQLGNGSGGGFTNSKSSPVQTISGGTNWKQVSAGYTPAAIKTDGALWTWGYNATYGDLGDGTTVDKSSPVQTVAGGTNWKQVSESSAIYFYDAGNLYPGGGGSYGPFSATISSSQSDLNLRTWALANGWDGSSAATIMIGASAFIYSTDHTTAALIINGAWPGGVTVLNYGIIMGKGGPGYPATSGAAAGGPAISLGVNATIINEYYILGGGGAGQAGYTYITSSWGYANVGGGGGAGGGNGGGGWFSGGTYGLVQTAYGGNGGGVGSPGGNATANQPGGGGGAGGGGGGYYSGTGGSLTAGGGGGGGRVDPGTATATGGTGGSSTSYAGGGQKISGDGGGNGSVGGNYLTTLGAGGGGGYGAAGGTGNGTGPYGGGGAGGKAIALNGYTATTSGGGTTYGSVS